MGFGVCRLSCKARYVLGLCQDFDTFTHQRISCASSGPLCGSLLKACLLKTLKFQHLLLFGGIAAISAVAPAHAVVQYQTVGPVSFSTPPNNPANIVFAPFTAGPAAQLLMVSLTGSTYNSAPTLNYGGFVQVGQFDAVPRVYGATATPLFKFSNNSAFSGTKDNISLSGNPVNTAGLKNLSASGSYGGTFNTIDAAGIASYFAGTPTVTVWNPNFATVLPTAPPGGGFFDNKLTLASPSLYLTYKYEDGKAPVVPGPLPILGASLAFGFSRNLRRRIQSSAS
jgi:hypothetical protein